MEVDGVSGGEEVEQDFATVFAAEYLKDEEKGWTLKYYSTQRKKGEKILYEMRKNDSFSRFPQEKKTSERYKNKNIDRKK